MARINVVKSARKPQGKCENCGNPIRVGDRYKWIGLMSGPRSSYKRKRCGDCPTWQVWDYSNSLSSRLAKIEYDCGLDVSNWESVEDAKATFDDAASRIREVAEEKRESAQNIEDGFGHETEKSQELNETADNLESWADEFEQADVPDFPEPEEDTCPTCEGSEYVVKAGEGYEAADSEDEGAEECPKCYGAGTFTPDEPTEEQIDTWRSEAEEKLSELFGSNPV